MIFCHSGYTRVYRQNESNSLFSTENALKYSVNKYLSRQTEKEKIDMNIPVAEVRQPKR